MSASVCSELMIATAGKPSPVSFEDRDLVDSLGGMIESSVSQHGQTPASSYPASSKQSGEKSAETTDDQDAPMLCPDCERESPKAQWSTDDPNYVICPRCV